MKLSITQEAAVKKLRDRGEEWTTPYRLSISMSTLGALVKKGLVECRGYGKPGAIFSPTTTYEYRIKSVVE